MDKSASSMSNFCFNAGQSRNLTWWTLTCPSLKKSMGKHTFCGNKIEFISRIILCVLFLKSHPVSLLIRWVVMDWYFLWQYSAATSHVSEISLHLSKGRSSKLRFLRVYWWLNWLWNFTLSSHPSSENSSRKPPRTTGAKNSHLQ